MHKFTKLLVVAFSLVVLSACSTQSARNLISFEADKNYQDMYLRGVFNWWEASDQFKLTRISPEFYTITIELIADGQPYDFKVANASWTPEFNCGFEYSPRRVELYDAVELVCEQTSQNIQFVPADTGLFTFEFDISNNNEPELTITKANN
ncbi:hypothetical protein [Glaciecola sp. 33A]|jgi:hypothetical protein|uniref:hypothetical protein n=1 Tax=Glaciecola sp. 33A TaxID=2057807 RepID=UPI000C3474D9|nr:hypothetical protein [Glaciecola sp. 33A]PKI01167.1 hypothetical protein CXF81_11665 [Glaciecola sp. 33A]